VEIRRLGLWNVQLANFLRCHEGRSIWVHGKQGSTIPQESTDKKTHVRYHRQIMCTSLVMGIKQIRSRIIPEKVWSACPKYLIHTGLYISLVIGPFHCDKAIQMLEIWIFDLVANAWSMQSPFSALRRATWRHGRDEVRSGFKFQCQKMRSVLPQSHYLQSMEIFISFILKDMMALEGSGMWGVSGDSDRKRGVYW